MQTENPHFEYPENWQRAAGLVDFEPSEPGLTGGHDLHSLAVFVRDHEHRELPRAERSLEAHYGAFVLSQSRPGAGRARQLALETSYGNAPQAVRIAGREARRYELGPEPGREDPDPRSPAVLVWCDGDRFYLLASEILPADELIPIAESIY
ncbi:MAG: hypothetical protein PVI79_13525 [Gammaproteobacteria bacterium]|jgi:hypothetical protein